MKKYFIIPMLFIILLFTGCTEKDISEINESVITKIYTDFDIEERTLVNNKEDIKNYINYNMNIENYNKFFDKNYEYYGLKNYHYNVNHYEKEVEYDFITKDLDIFLSF